MIIGYEKEETIGEEKEEDGYNINQTSLTLSKYILFYLSIYLSIYIPNYLFISHSFSLPSFLFLPLLDYDTKENPHSIFFALLSFRDTINPCYNLLM